VRRVNRFALPLAVAAAWTAAGSTILPVAASVTFGALCVLVLPGLCIERLLSAGPAPYGAAAAPARWVTFSAALTALLGLAVSAGGGSIHALLLSIAVASVVSAALPVRAAYPPRVSDDDADRIAPAAAERIARAALVVVIVLAVILAAAAPNVARDRMWYLAFVTHLDSGAPIDWSEPFLGTGAIAARFAYNGWLLSLAAWSSLTGATPSLVFERLAPPILTVAAASAAWHFGRRTVPAVPGLAALASMAAMLATRFPFFSPDRYPFFARVAEDKSVALLVFAPVALAAVVDAIDDQRQRSPSLWTSLALGLVAVAFAHGLVMFFVGIAIVFLLVTLRAGGNLSARRVLAALALSAIVAAVPGRMAMLARNNIVDVDEPAAAWSEDVRHPVVRAHLRLERTRDLPFGGPIVDPLLVANPVLLAGLAGIVVAWRRRRHAGAAVLVASSLPFLALAFVPFLAPLFGKVVLPWMAYRALWLIPFGSLLALLLASIPHKATSNVVRASVAVTLLATTLAALPWSRSGARPNVVSPLRDHDTRELLSRIATLPADSRIAAAPGFAELVPAIAGRAAVAVADRGTFVFAGSRTAAEARLRAAAAIVGLAPGSVRFRRAEAQRSHATHFVLHDRSCGRVGREVFRSGPLRLCAVIAGEVDTRGARVVPLAPSAAPPQESTHAMRAALDTGIACLPRPEREHSAKRESDVHRWTRESRWTAKPVAIRCRATIAPPAGEALTLALSAELPRARETIVLRAVLRTADGRKIVRHAAVSLDGNRTSAVSLPGTGVQTLRLRLAPAYLPYLSLRELALWERRVVGE
jgi:hypothetical protein